MKKMLLTTLCLTVSLLFSRIQAQENPYAIRSIPISENPADYDNSDFTGLGKVGIIRVMAKGANAFIFQRYSTDLKLEKENKTSSSGKIPGESAFNSLFRWKNKVYALMNAVENNKRTVFVWEVDPLQLEFIGNPIVIAELSVNTDSKETLGRKMVAYQGNNSGATFLIPSNDSSKLLFASDLGPVEKEKDKKGKEVNVYKMGAKLQVLDNNFQKVWGGEYVMPYAGTVLSEMIYTLGNDGKVYALGKVSSNGFDFYNKDQAKEKPTGPYHYELFIYEKDSKTPKMVELKTDCFVKEAKLMHDANKNIIVIGTYAKDIKELENTDGFFTLKLDLIKSDFTKLNEGYYPIPSAVIKEGLSERDCKKIDKAESKGESIGPYNLTFTKFYSMPNGSLKLISEMYWHRLESGVSDKSPSKWVFYNEDIYVASINKAGKMEWLKKIHKNQFASSYGEANSSFDVFTSGDDVNLFYLDNATNDKVPEDKARPYDAGSNGIVKGVRIDASGNVSKYTIGNTKDYDVVPEILYFREAGQNNSVSIEVKRKKYFLFSIIRK